MKKIIDEKIRLTPDVTPLHYDIFLHPDLEKFVFEGEETITLTVSKPTNKITLHAAELEIKSATLILKKEAKARVSYNKDYETVTFQFKNNIPKGKASIKIAFTGILNDKMRGFYRSRYDHEGQTYHMGVTQFESTDARRAFPCFDEPAMKATFDVTLKVPQDRTVISNTIEKESMRGSDGTKTVSFTTTPKMSSYLLAIIIGHFDYVEKTTKEGVLVRVFVTPGKKKQAEFALDVAGKLMSFYHKFFGIAYPLPTMDLIAIPDFANGAMENWGAVTYRETALLVDEKNSSLHTKQWVALIIAHELAHQWFGNLVTMKWWTDLWLNEGFASFMEYLAVDKLFPDWRVWTQFVYTEQARALALDGLENTHPIEIPVHHPGEISEIFDAVSYSKGASVIRMIESFVGEENFRKGLILYLTTNKYANAETKDLWNALAKVSGKPVGKIMNNWTTKPGYPLVNIEKKKDTLFVSQEKYFSNPLVENRERQSWLVPLSLIANDIKTPVTLLLDRKMEISGFGKSKWIKANANDTSFIRVRYTEENLEALTIPIKKNDPKLGEEGRFAIIRDAFALTEAGYIPSSEAFELIFGYENEKSYIVWAEIISHLLEFKSLLYEEDIYERFQKYGRKILNPIANHIGWKKEVGELHESTLLRSTVTYALGSMGDKKIIKQAQKIFAKSMEGGKIDSDVRSVVYSLVAENGGKKEYKIFLKIYKTASSEEEKDRALRALCSFKSPELLGDVLTLTFSKDVRSQDAFKAISLMSLNPVAIDLAWEYVKEHWEELEHRFAGGHLFSRFVMPFSRFTTIQKADEIKKFFKKNRAPGIERTVAQTVEKIRSNAHLLSRDLSGLTAALKKWEA